MKLEEAILKKIKMLLDRRKKHEEALRQIDEQLHMLADAKPDIPLFNPDRMSIAAVAEFIFISRGNEASHVNRLLEDIRSFGKKVGGRIPTDTLAACLQQDEKRFIRCGRNTYKLQDGYYNLIKRSAQNLQKSIRNIKAPKK